MADTRPADTDFFVSRAGPDREVGQFVAATLEAAGYSVILQDWDFGNQSFVRAMDDALISASRVVAILSQSYLDRPHCRAEWQAALQSDTTNASGRLIVFRCDDCAPAGLLGSIAYTDLAPVLSDEGRLRERVLAAVKPGARRSGDLSSFQRAALITNILEFEVPLFSGRETELALVAGALSEDSGRCVLTGLGGIGKTALVREYARRFRDAYSGVWWIGAEDRAGLFAGLAQLAVRLEPHLAENSDQRSLAARALERLNAWSPERPWLVIYDNAEGPQGLADVLPEGPGAHVLVTSRFSAWSAKFRAVSVGTLPRSASVEILLAGAGRGSPAEADALAETLGDHALAIRHAASYLRENPLETFDTFRQDVDRRLSAIPESEGMSKSVGGTLAAAISAVTDRHPVAGRILEVMAFLNPEGVDVDLFASDAFPPDWKAAIDDEDARRAALNAMLRYSLLSILQSEWGGRQVSVHRLVQAIVQKTLGGRCDEVRRMVGDVALGSFRLSNRRDMQRTYFGGRDGELEKLERVLWREQAPIAVTGLGGIGKSSIALEYASRSRHRYGLFWWVPCEDRHDALTALAQLGRSLFGERASRFNLEDAALSAVSRLSDWQTNRKILLLYDNADSAAHLNGLLPSGDATHVVVTSRAVQWPAPFHTLLVPPLSGGEAADTLRRLVPSGAGQDLEPLFNITGGHALALRVAGAFLSANPSRSIGSYVDDLTRRTADTGTPGALAATIAVSLSRLEEISPDAGDLLRLLSLFHPDRAPRELLALAFAHLCGVDELAAIEHRLKEALDALIGYSLVRLDDRPDITESHLLSRLIFVHRLVQDGVRDAAGDEHRKACVKAIASLFPERATDPRQWDVAELLVPQLRKVVERTRPRSWEAAQLRSIAGMGAYFAARAMNGEAETYLRQAVEVAEARPDLGPELALYRNNLAAFLQSTGREAEAGAIQQRIGTADTAAAPAELLVLENQALLAAERGRFDEAEALLTRLIESTDPRDAELGGRQRRLADIFIRTGRAVEAERMLRQITRAAEMTGRSPQLSDALGSLAAATFAQSRFEEAFALVQQALEVDEELFGRDHPRLVARLVFAADVAIARGDAASAEPLARRALAIAEPGEDSAATIAASMTLATALQHSNQHHEALICIERALVLADQTLAHAENARALTRAAELRSQVGDFENAIKFGERGLALLLSAGNASAAEGVRGQLTQYRARRSAGASDHEISRLETSRAAYGHSESASGNAIFVSYASRNRILATQLHDWLGTSGFTDVFIDFASIQSGEKWQDALRRAKSACRVVLCLVTPEWLTSDECFSEFNAALYMGKRIVPLLAVTESQLDEKQRKRFHRVLADHQGLDIAAAGAPDALDLDAHAQAGLSLASALRSAGALARVGLDPEAFEINRTSNASPFPGLASFNDTDADAAVFYGRSIEIAAVLEDLREMRATGDARAYVVLGPAGSGKSSLLRAGVLPRLRRERGWLALRAFRPGADPLFSFADAIARTEQDLGEVVSPAEVHNELRAAGQNPAELARALAVRFARLAERADRADATTLITIDQADDLIAETSDNAALFVACVRALLSPESGNGIVRCQFVLTVRSDAFADLQKSNSWLDLRPRDLRPIPAFRLAEAIEKPAARYGVSIDVDLVESMLDDCSGAAEPLPLLAFALSHLWSLQADAGVIRSRDYAKVGRLAGLLEEAAERVLRSLANFEGNPASFRLPPRLNASLARMFVPTLIGLNEHGAPVTRAAPLEQFSEEERVILERFSDARLVMLSAHAVEISSPVLAREWPRLRVWVQDQARTLEALQRIERGAHDWVARGHRSADLLLDGASLREGIALLRRSSYAPRIGRDAAAYVRACARRSRERLLAHTGVLLLVLGLASLVVLQALVPEVSDNIQMLLRRLTAGVSG